VSSTVSLHYGNSTEFREWDPSVIKNISPAEVEFKNSFESLDVSQVACRFNEYLKPYFDLFDISELDISVSSRIGVSDFIAEAYSFSYDNSDGAVVFSEHGAHSVKTYFSNDLATRGEEGNNITLARIAIEYFVMKVLGGLCHAIGNASFEKFSYTGAVSSEDLQEYAGEVLYMTFASRLSSFTLELVLPYSLVRHLNETSSRKIPYKNVTSADLKGAIEPLRYSVPIYTFEVPPGDLIDYLQADAIIMFEEYSLTKVSPVFLNQTHEAYAQVMRCQGNFLLCYTDEKHDELIKTNALHTKVQVVLIDEKAAPEDLLILTKCYKTRTEISSKVYLEISGEIVATGMLGYINDTLSVKVLST
jgi:hypothetical protein